MIQIKDLTKICKCEYCNCAFFTEQEKNEDTCERCQKEIFKEDENN